MRADRNTLGEFVQIGELHLHPVTIDDEHFLKFLFRQSRPFLREIPLPAQFVDALVQQQYELQKASYAQNFPGSYHFLILQQQEPVGRLILYLDKENASLRVVDICLLPQHCGRGYGSALLWSLQSLASRNGWHLCLSVDCQNWRAKKLYEALGFQLSGTSATHHELVWSAETCVA